MKSKSITKNTSILYLRMLITMVLSFVISRLLLKNLGIEDYGIYGVVGSVVTLFSFLNIALITAGQRCLSFEMGKNENKEKLVFKSIFTFCFIIAVSVLLILFIFGNSLVNELNIPIGRMDAAKNVFHFSTLTFFISTLIIPFSSFVIADEEISFYASVNVVDIILRLLVVCLLSYLPGDSLVNYGFLLILNNLILLLIYFIKLNKTVKVGFDFNRVRFKEISKYFGWNLLGGLASISLLQGIQILINLFFNPIFNAAQTLSIQIKSAVDTFAANIRTASNPRIMKLCAANNHEEAYNILSLSIKLSTVAILLIAIPLLVKTQLILSLWLKNVPPYTSIFVKLVLVNCIIDVVSSPIVSVIQSIGNLKNYQITSSLIILLVLPFTYLFFYLNFEVYIFGIFIITSSILILFLRLYFLKRIFHFSVNDLLISIFKQIIIIPILVFLPTYFISTLLREGVLNLMVSSIFSISLILLLCFSLLFDNNEKIVIREFLNSKKNKIFK